MEQEWNENIEQIIEQKSFVELTSADKSVLGEIAESEFTYNSYRSLLTDVVPSFKANSITKSKALDERVLAVAENKKAAWYTSPFVRYSAAAAVVLLLGTTIFWFVNNNIKQDKAEMAVNEKSTQSEEKKDHANYAKDSALVPNESIESKIELEATSSSDELNNQDFDVVNSNKPNPIASLDEAPKVENTTVSNAEVFSSRLNDFKSNNSAEIEEEFDYNVDESDDDQYKVVSEEVMPAYSSNDKLTSTVARAKENNTGINKDVRDEIVGTINLSKPASDEKDAFDLLIIAF